MKQYAYRYLLFLCVLSIPVFLNAQAGPPPGGPGGGGGRPGGGSGGTGSFAGPVSQAEISVARVFTTVAGRLEPELRLDHKSPLNGIIVDVFVTTGQYVTPGQALFSVVQDADLNIFRPVTVTSRLQGNVSNVNVVKQQEVNSGSIAVTVIDTSTMRLEAAVSDVDAFSITTGIRVSGRNAANTTFAGVLTGISSEPDYNTGLFTARFTFPRASGMRTGEFLLIEVPVAEVRGVFVHPDSVIRRYGKNRVWILDGDENIQSVEVKTGQIVGGRLLIESGLTPETRYISSPTGGEQEGMALSELLGERG